MWAKLIGWIAFGTFPDGYALAGMSIIAGAGLLITLHERRRAQTVRAQAEPLAGE